MNPIERAGQQFIDGAWIASTSSELIDVIDPTTEQPFAQVASGTAEDADAAVKAARAALPVWSSLPVKERTAILRKAAEILKGSTEEIATIISREVGTTIDIARAAQVGRPLEVISSLADAADELEWVEQVGATLVVREHLGVVVAITPWNFPLHQAIAKIAAALAAGCTVVLKPSELAPLSAYALADALAEAGVPAGAFNVVTGLGTVVGEALITHPDVDGISFTGSTAVGRHIGAAAAQTVKRVALELGGKGPSVVLPGADVKAAALATAARCFTNSGQVCAALSRFIVPRDQLAAAEEALTEYIGQQQLGNPLDEATTVGPVISATQRDRVKSLIDGAIADGARVVAGGPDAEIPSTGYFVAPTVFSDVTTGSMIAQTEVFGPVLAVLPYDTVEEAVAIANDSEYGLVGAVWGPDVTEAAKIAGQIRVGMIGVNGGRINVKAPFGGYKQSGLGREFGSQGVEEFLEVKSMNFPSIDAVVPPAV